MKKTIIAVMIAVWTLLLAVVAGLFWIRPTVFDHQRLALEAKLIGLIEGGQTEMAAFSAPAVENEQNVFPELGMGQTFIGDADFNMTACGVLSISAIELEMPVAAATDLRIFRVSAGWDTRSAPIGTAGNCVIYGHRLNGYGRHFNRLDELQKGDSVVITTAEGECFRYTVTDSVVVKPEELTNKLSQYDAEKMLTLVTERGTGDNSHRLLVFAELDDSVG